MQAKGIIESNMSFQYYKSEYLDNLEDIEITNTNNIDLLWFEKIIYNKGCDKTYQHALESLSSQFEKK